MGLLSAYTDSAGNPDTSGLLYEGFGVRCEEASGSTASWGSIPGSVAGLALLSLKRSMVGGRMQILQSCLIILISDEDRALGLYL